MNKPDRVVAVEAHLGRLAGALGRQTVNRELSGEEVAAMTTILRAAVQALRHGFIQRLAEQVTAERETETVEEFFENLKPD